MTDQPPNHPPPTLCGNCKQQPATCTYVTEDNTLFPLCNTCGEAFELGQANPDANMYKETAIAICADCGDIIDLDNDAHEHWGLDYWCAFCSDNLDGKDPDDDNDNSITHDAHIEDENAPGGYTLEMMYEDRVSAGYESENYENY